jgi:hypothetical protein
MSRPITTALLNALTSNNIRPFYAVELLFDTSPLRFWTGLGDRTINVQGSNQVFTGASTLLTVGEFGEVKDLSAENLELTLSGVPSEIISLALQEPYQRRTCRVYMGEQSVSDVTEVFGGKMDTMSISDSAEDSVISLSVESKLVELERSSGWRYTDENHQSRYNGDTFFSYVTSIQDKQIAWGRESV